MAECTGHTQTHTHSYTQVLAVLTGGGKRSRTLLIQRESKMARGEIKTEWCECRSVSHTETSLSDASLQIYLCAVKSFQHLQKFTSYQKNIRIHFRKCVFTDAHDVSPSSVSSGQEGSHKYILDLRWIKFCRWGLKYFTWCSPDNFPSIYWVKSSFHCNL